MTSKKIPAFMIIFSIAASLCFTSESRAESIDYRAYAHGISYVENPVTHKNYLIWSDAFKKGIDDDGDWTHDVYLMKINTKKPKVRGVKRIIKADEAQEPASASCTDNGNMIVTFEDGDDTGDYGLYQRFAIYNKKMKKIVKYPSDIAAGGHSGHAASTSDKHIVFWNEGWIEGGGSDNLGSGDDIYVTSMDSDGQNQKTIPVVKSKESRDWWPLLAASNDKALLLWQRYVDDESYAHLCYSVYDPSKGALETISENNAVIELPDYKLKYYCYNIVYLKNLKAYAVNLTTVDNGGILLLIDEKGKIIKEIKECEDFVREAAPAVKESGSYTLYYPVSSSSVQAFEIGSDYSVKKTDYSTDYTWTYCGTAGFLDKKGNVFFASLDSTHFKKGKKTLKLVKLDLEQS